MNTVIYPGTFDPITNGHLDIIQRSAALFPKVLVAVAANPNKKPLFSLSERLNLVRQSVCELHNVEVIAFEGLLADLLKQKQIHAIIRGVRSANDFDYELQLAHLNRLLSEGVESIFLPPSERWSYLSSTMIREIHLHQGDVSQLVPKPVHQALLNLK
ncbi:pantetheine-phosphate adenylyltransferase [[Haemophilus] felis]|uniref:Phosphopantetheine adenylyltransferase n=1 Tax=[Haemophilus] felis TaxID=123822 RepID=A0A1T0B2H6_9PAST|nr:pantetheine-phosphate adenylyltransferase [[Haemophilus] felis]NBI40265.1 pantetheine-phosphate adenylyltransferase [[Haemophilus] felis]OOS04325.1 pantetheine-phosphate adenylyltransferase [[Haemophilus] felis]